jgi:hypothetical protein
MSGSRNKRQRQANRPSAVPRRTTVIYDELIGIVHGMPLPKDVPAGEWTGKNLKGGLAPAVAWGWLLRITRSGQAAIHLENIGFGAETPPLTRSAIEHAIRLLWAAEFGDGFVDVALLAKEQGLRKILAAQTALWSFDKELADAMEQHILEAASADKSLGHLAHLRQIVDQNPEERGPLYMGWLIDTQDSHPSLASAQPYYTVVAGDNTRVQLEWEPRFSTAVHMKATLALISGLHAYAKIAGDAERVEPRLEDIIQRLKGR